MSKDEEGWNIKIGGEEWSNSVFYIVILILIILCAGKPDLLDAITNYVQSLSEVKS